MNSPLIPIFTQPNNENRFTFDKSKGLSYNPTLCKNIYTAKTPVLNSTPPVLWEVHTKLVLILTPDGVNLIPLGVKFNTGGCYSNTYQC